MRDERPIASEHRHISTAPSVADAIALQERERVRIGFDLHDGPAQTMSAALLQVKMLEDLQDEDLQAGVAELRGTLAVALQEIYALIEDLGGRESGDDDLVTRVRSCVDAFAERSDISVHLSVDGSVEHVSQSLQIAVTRIVQEALSNARRHSGAGRVDITLQLSPERVVCEIADDGDGFVCSEGGGFRGGREPYGLHSMRERARLLDGKSVVESTPGTGTRVRVEIPVWSA